MPMWDGAIVVLIGGGHSLKEYDFAQLPILKKQHGLRFIGINAAFRLGKWVDACWFGDNRFFDWNHALLSRFGGLKATCAPATRVKKKGIAYYERRNKDNRKKKFQHGIDTRPGHVAWNINSGASGLNYAYHLGSRKIILLGFDHKVGPEGQHNYHTHHKVQGASKDPYNKRFQKGWDVIGKQAPELGIQIINAGPDSDLKVFPLMTLEEGINELKKS